MSRLSACLIVRDEERNLAACLESLKPWVDEICVLDTGSKDGTLAVAEELADRVERFEWCADFSAARNRALELATGEWILSVDADEVLDSATGPALREAIQDERRQAWWVTVASDLESGAVQNIFLPRLFRNRAEIRWRRPVHESVIESLIDLGAAGSIADSGVRLLHSGYVGEAVSKKRVRNLMLLRKRAMEAPDDLYNTYKLAVTLRDSDQAAEQLSTFDVAHRLAEGLSAEERGTYPFLPLVYDGFGACLMANGRLGHARRVLDRGLELYPSSPELHLRRGELARALGDDRDARAHYAACRRSPDFSPLQPTDPRVRGFAPALGSAWLAAERGDPEAAMAELERALDLDPDHLGARCLEIQVRLSEEELAQEGLRALDLLMQRWPEANDVRILAGEVALARGDRDTACDLWRAAALTANDPRARTRLAVGELATGRIESALEHLPKLRDTSLRAAACRAVLAIVAGVPLELDEALDRQRVLAAMVPWLRELVDAPVQTALQTFAANSRLYTKTLPDVDRLLVPADEPAAALPSSQGTTSHA